MSWASKFAATERRNRQALRDRDGPRRVEGCLGKCGREREVVSWSDPPFWCESCKPLPTEPVYTAKWSAVKPELHRINVEDWKAARRTLERRLASDSRPPGPPPAGYVSPLSFMAECGEYVGILSMRKYEPAELADKPRCGKCFGGTNG